ncbi:aspartate/glutamate racemase family protein [Phaeobacter inhibens]|uniref:aspartate/glutamate racemase family protein n=1 Tax=Phaeobacter inhibens TaxID=221822 RepID=UPI00076BB38C|nr:aspartate/glutamate racemase family protein [Phaeobacter inhibens]KXF92301.1 Asp/Glu/hydantoin racemase [Phaeobacter inhibens]WHP68775.1 aspartate/glutamate racemase family protein [Phaeobacter inhibens]
MEILVINPNTTHSMTKKIAAAASMVARSTTKIIATESQKGPASIEGFHDIALCLGGLIEEASKYADVDAVVVACFDDTGLDALRCLFDVPVIGIGEAAYHAASMISTKFSVVTTLSRSVPGLEANLERYGLAKRCARVRASDVPVLKLEENDPACIAVIKDEIRAAIEEDGAEAVVLGCAGMADLMESLSEEFGIPIIDGVASATCMAEALVAAGLKTSKIGAYAQPRNKVVMVAV